MIQNEAKKQYEDKKKQIEQDKQLKTIHMSEGNYKKEVKNIVINCMVEYCNEESGRLN